MGEGPVEFSIEEHSGTLRGWNYIRSTRRRTVNSDHSSDNTATSGPTASERAIEDILVQSPHILASILGIDPGVLVPAARQESLPSGRSDLVFLAGNAVLLIELKVTDATADHVAQLAGYAADYRDPDTRPAFAVDRNLRPILLAPTIPTPV